MEFGGTRSVAPDLADIRAAASRLRPILSPSPLRRSFWLEEHAGCPVYLKMESVQLSGSFKIRGAYNKLLALRPKDAPCGLITASSGNHGLALAMACKERGFLATLVVPVTTPRVKIDAMKLMGARIITHGQIYDEAELYALDLSARCGLTYVPAFADRDVIAGQATIAVEIFEQLESPDIIAVPVGGGGLISGISLFARAAGASTRVVGIQPQASGPMYESFRAREMVTVNHGPTLSDGTAGGISPATLDIVLHNVDDMEMVTEEAIRNAIRGLFVEERLIVEGAGALTVAALLSGNIWSSGPLVLVLSGSNIDSDVLARVVGQA